MKIIKLSFLFFVLFASCTEKENNPSAIRLVSRIESYENIDGSSTRNTMEFHYDGQNRIIEIINTDVNGKSLGSTIRYLNNNTMVVSDSVTYMLNSSGFITSQSINNQLVQSCTYAGVYLQKMEIDMTRGTAMPSKISQNYTWKNGNITHVTTAATILNDPQLTYSSTTTYEYSNISNGPCIIDLAFFFSFSPRGWFGKPVLKLPSKTTTKIDNINIKDNEDSLEDTAFFRYEIDAHGYPVRIYIRENDDNETLLAAIEYKD